MSNPALIRLWRLVKVHRAASAWDGEGAYRFGGRWNSPGQRMVYTSSSLSLALVEILVHLDAAATLPELVALPIDVPADAITPSPLNPPADCCIAFNHDVKTTRQIGDRWLDEATSPGLAVPSAIVPLEQNILLNPNHPAMHNYHVGTPHSFFLDARLGN